MHALGNPDVENAYKKDMSAVSAVDVPIAGNLGMSTGTAKRGKIVKKGKKRVEKDKDNSKETEGIEEHILHKLSGMGCIGIEE